MAPLLNFLRKNLPTEIKSSSFTEERCLKLLFDQSPDIIILFDTEGKFLDINKATTSITGYKLPETALITDFTPAELKDQVWTHFQAAVKGKVQKFTSQAYHKDGSLLNLEITHIPIKEHHKTIGVYAIIHDVSEKITLQSTLEMKVQELEHASDTLKAAIWSYDNIRKSITFCSKGVKHIAEMDPEKFLKGQTQWRDLVYIDDQKSYEENIKHLKQGESICHRYRITTPSGKIKWLNEKILPIIDNKNNIIRYHGIVTDITKDKELGDRVEHLLHHDTLTALPNRKMLENEMKSYIQQNTKFAFIYIDLNRFKYINESLGPVIGDQILAEAARRLLNLQDKGIFVSSFNHNNFVLLMKDYKGLNSVTALCKGIITQLKEPYVIGELELLMTISIGISLYPSDSNGINELFQNASAAMNRAKETGKNSYQLYSPENSIDAYKRFVLEKDFRYALNNDEMQLYFQPKVDVRLNKIIGSEALLRWNHPEWGLVSPNEFIPYAEENGFIIDVGEWVFEKACMTLKEWRNQGISLVPVSVNLSPQHFLVKDLTKNLLSVLEKYALPSWLIQLEITEAVFLHHEEIVKQTIDELREKGFRILIDDFGTGYTSFAYLKDLTVDGIKIDRSYTKELGSDSKNGAIIKNLASLSEDLNMSATIEGIETKEQLEYLRKINCHFIQGYVYSKPVPVEEFVTMLREKTIKPLSRGTRSFTFERRQYFRLHPRLPLEGFTTIVSINNRKITTGKTSIAITDIGPGGLGFISHIQFPPNRDILLEFSLRILGEDMFLKGKVVWKEEVDEDFFRYGVAFLLTEAERETLTKSLNTLSLALKRDIAPGNTNLIEKDLFEFLREVKNR
ncbi:EAL domain-containing protein [Bacillus salacetis]|uniref:EAL domain-containing protein n=1 Tax=Bacillus salacetis TaxID=2315464 RepID=UPI003BA04DDF